MILESMRLSMVLAALLCGALCNARAEPDGEEHLPQGSIPVLAPILRGFAYDQDAPGRQVAIKIEVEADDGQMYTIDARANAAGAYGPRLVGVDHDLRVDLTGPLAAHREHLHHCTVRVLAEDLGAAKAARSVASPGRSGNDPGPAVGSAPGAGFVTIFQRSHVNLADRLPPPRSDLVMTRRVLLIVLDPVMHSRGDARLSTLWGRDPAQLARSTAADLERFSGGLLRIQLSRPEHDPEEWPVLQLPITGFEGGGDPRVYNETMFLADHGGGGSWTPRWKNQYPENSAAIDYNEFFRKHCVVERIGSAFDEVWVCGPPWGGFYESTMAGDGAYRVNSPPVGQHTNDSTPVGGTGFITMAFNYERDVDQALHAFGHRCEAILDRTFGDRDGAHPWAAFAKYTGRAGVGQTHFPPNAIAGYDYASRRVVASNCDRFLLYPEYVGEQVLVNNAEWGMTPARADEGERPYQQWWFEHIPHAAGRSSQRLNNWWPYLADPNRALQPL